MSNQLDKTTKNIFLIAVATFFFLGLVIAFNFSVDPMCYYRCETIELSRKTQNVYYRSAQTAVANPQAQVIVVGSSRGERVSPFWVQSVTGLKTINLSQGGADLLLKIALLNIVLERNPQIKQVIWMADYFELLPTTTDIKTRLTPVLQKYSNLASSGLKPAGFFEKMQGLIDHRTLEAGLELLGKSSTETFEQSGSGSEVDYLKCQDPSFSGPTSKEMLGKKIDESYSIFSSGWWQPQDPFYWDLFEKEIHGLSAKGIKVTINVAPYHPILFDRVVRENAIASKYQKEWAERVGRLSDVNVQVLRFENGVPNDDGGPRFWEDGAHPTCFAVIEMLKTARALKSQDF